MLPTLLSIGPVKLYSYGVCLAIGLFVSLYFWWKMGRDEHWDEIALFDGFFLSLLIYFIAGRVVYVLAHFGDLGTLYRSLAVLSYPGINVVGGILATSVFVVLFARAQSWHVWKVMDSYVVALSIVLVLGGGLGGLLNGSNPAWQVNIWTLVWALITFATTSRVRKNFRFYSWYKGESSVAQEGLASLVFILLLGVYCLVVGWIGQSMWRLGVVPVEFVLGLLLIGGSVFLIKQRVGKREAHWVHKLREMRLSLLQSLRRKRG